MTEIDAQYRKQMNQIAKSLDVAFNGDTVGKERSTGFVLLMFPFNDTEGGRTNYISNGADRRDIIVLMKEMIARFEGQAETSGRA